MHGTQVAERPVTISIDAGDDELVARVRAGDDGAFETLYEADREARAVAGERVGAAAR